ncbi:hypothetical protein AC579_9882 [Pseudocercospora musae]|uniref:Uncharacterized protein n=1 Tax=Pseudocercospora musae TaxID=113226 RepID=A0A139I9M5_9PEZI|nr:hypothetical protein AC579_9882 [Pseudocercospora musae]
MVANKHRKRPAPMVAEENADKQKPKSSDHPMNVCEGIWSSVIIREDDTGAQSTQRYEWDQLSLQPYTKFKNLYGERKYSRPHPPKPSHTSFLDLPAELHNRVYRLALIHNEYIELSAKTNLENHSNGDAQRVHMKHYHRKITPSLRLLRINKQVNKEAASISYGEHEFRFTSARGIYILERSLFTIGPYNQSCLRKLTLHARWPGTVGDNGKDKLAESGGTLAHMAMVVRRMGLRTPDYKFSEDLCKKRVKTGMEKYGNLAELSIVMPASFHSVNTYGDERPGELYDFFLDQSKFKQLKIRLVRLHGGYAYDPPEETYSDQLRTATLGSHLEVRKYARRMGHEVIDVAYDKLGNWPVPLMPGQHIVEIEGDDQTE